MSTEDNTFRRVDWFGDQPQPSDDDDEHGLPLQPPRGPGLTGVDLELLTLAARALGATVEAVEGEQWVTLQFAGGAVSHGWNPLRHSDDALDLTVRLKLSIDVREGAVCVIAGETEHVIIETGVGSDLVVATRRAVTRAAAEIGKTRQ